MDYDFGKINVCKYPICLKDKHFQGFQRKLAFRFCVTSNLFPFSEKLLLVDFVMRKEDFFSNDNCLSFRGLIPKCIHGVLGLKNLYIWM